MPCIRSKQQATHKCCAQVFRDTGGSFAARLLQNIHANYETENRTSHPLPINIKGIYISQSETFPTVSTNCFHYAKWSLVGFFFLSTHCHQFSIKPAGFWNHSTHCCYHNNSAQNQLEYQSFSWSLHISKHWLHRPSSGYPDVCFIKSLSKLCHVMHLSLSKAWKICTYHVARKIKGCS